MNSDFINGLNVHDAKETIINKLVELKIGEQKINYRLRDWESQDKDIGAALFQ